METVNRNRPRNDSNHGNSRQDFKTAMISAHFGSTYIKIGTKQLW